MNPADPSLFLSELLRPGLKASPDRVAVQTADKSWSYRELDETAAALACRWLATGLQTGDRMAFLLPNRMETLLCYLACFKAGFVAVPLDYQYRPPQINYSLRHSGSRLLVAHAERQAELSEVEAARGMSVTIVGDSKSDNSTAFEDRSDPFPGTAPNFPQNSAATTWPSCSIRREPRRGRRASRSRARRWPQASPDFCRASSCAPTTSPSFPH